MKRPKPKYLLLSLIALSTSMAGTAGAVNGVFLSNDSARSPATYIVEFNPTVAGAIDKIRLTFPTGSNPGGAALGRVHVAGKAVEDAVASIDPADPAGLTLIVDLRKPAKTAIGARVRIELFNIDNPVEGNYDNDISTLTAKNLSIETLAPVPLTIFAVGDMGNFNTASGDKALLNNTGGSNTASGHFALNSNTSGGANTAVGRLALSRNTNGSNNTASGVQTLFNNTTGNSNTATGNFADVSTGNLFNATAIGSLAVVNASNKIRLGNTSVSVLEGEVAFTASSDASKKENFRPVDGEEVLGKIRGFELTSWNFIGHNPKEFRHYGPMAQEFFAAFGHDGVGTIGTPTTINSGDLAGILMSAVQALEKRTVELNEKDARIAALETHSSALREEVMELRSENAELKARLETVERLVRERPGLRASVAPLR